MLDRHLEDQYAPLTEEHTLTDLPVAGVIPDYLDGRYLRNGPNPIGEIDPELYHWFVGDGMVHGIRIRDGKAEWYRNRWVRGPLAAKALGEREPVGHYGFSPVGANTNVIEHAGKTLALVESGLASYELTPELDTVGVCDFDGTLTGGYTAHPLRDPQTGELHAVSYSMHGGNQVQYTVIGVDGRVRRSVDVTVTGSPMMHSFSLTQRYVVFYDLPVTFDAHQAASMGILDPIAAQHPWPKDSDRRFPYSWNPDYPARVGVMPRDGGNDDVRWFEVQPCYVFHPLNAYDDGETIVADVVRHPTTFDGVRPPAGPPTMDRWTIDLSDNKLREARFDDRGQEFPRVDERRVGLRHRYGYVPTARAGAGALLKHDFVKGRTQSRTFGPDKALGEFVFQPSSQDAAEDDGVLMGYVYDRADDRSELAILDAQTLQDVAAIKLPHRVPAGFHGNWLPS
jgi:carotenoid cleavage oxygenase